MIQSAIELRGARFLWACDLSKPDTLFMIPGFNFPFNPLPLLMGATMLWQARLTPRFFADEALEREKTEILFGARQN